MTINLKVPDLRELKPRITVVGVGGAGGNAVNNMITAGLEGVEFVVANTDAQALAMSRADRQIQMGVEVTEGLGAGSKPQVGAKAAEEAMPDVKAQLAGSHMAFITAGMGGGTGTGAAPVIAQAAKEEGILTVGVVTKPFQFEGSRRLATAEEGITELQRHVDTLIIIPNQNLFRIANETTTFADAFAMADEVLHSGVACITDLMVKEGLINLDFADVRTVMSEMGRAMMGTGEASGDRRAIEAAEAAISNPLLDDVSMRGASGLLISITGGEDMTLYEVDEAATRIREEVDAQANIIVGATFDDELDGRIRVSVVSTGIGVASDAAGQDAADEQLEHAYKAACKPRLVEQVEPEAVEAAEADDDADAMPVPEGPTETWSGPDGITIEPARPKVIVSDDEADEPAEATVEDDEEFEPAAPARLARQPRRMPDVEDFPVVGQNELRARDADSGEHGVEVQKKKAGFLERLANVGRRVHTDEESIDRDQEPVMDLAEEAEILPDTKAAYGEPMSAPSIHGRPKSKAEDSQDESAMDAFEDEEFEIPAFLRRQASL